jgi:hypothetical protein
LHRQEPAARSAPDLLASPQNATNRPGFGREEISMLNQLLHDDLVQALVNAHNSQFWARAKKLLLEGKEGEEVEYELYEDQKGSRAKNVMRV